MLIHDESCKDMVGLKQKCEVIPGLSKKFVKFFQDETFKSA